MNVLLCSDRDDRWRRKFPGLMSVRLVVVALASAVQRGRIGGDGPCAGLPDVPSTNRTLRRRQESE